MTCSAQRPSSMAWYGCMLGMTPQAARTRGCRRARGAARARCGSADRAGRSPSRDALVDVEQGGVGAVADRVHHHVQAGRIGAADPGVEIVRRVDEEAAVLRRVGERLVERRGVRTERAVDEALQPADAQPRVAAAVRPIGARLHRVASCCQVFERHRRRRCAWSAGRPACARVNDLEIGPRAHVVHASSRPVRRRSCIAASSARSCISAEGGGIFAVDELHRVVLEQPGRLAARRRERSRRR